jgi:hypothetical protein
MGLTPSTAATALRAGANISSSRPSAGEAACTITPTDQPRSTTIHVLVVPAESLAAKIEDDVYQRPSATRGMRGLGAGAVLLLFEDSTHVDAHVWFEAGPFGVEVTGEAPSALAVARAIFGHLG